MIMELEFKNQEELYKRVKPALKSKRLECKRYGIEVSEEELWMYLSENIFKKSHNLTLADIVSEIMHLEKDNFIK